MASFDTDRNLLFGVVALQGEMIDAGQLAEACTAWSARKDRLLAMHTQPEARWNMSRG